MYSFTELLMARKDTRDSVSKLNFEVEPDVVSDLCRVKRKEGEYGGYRKDILTENLTEKEDMLLVCEICEGIMRDGCLSSSGAQFCSCCEIKEPVYVYYLRVHQSNPSKQTPNVNVRKMVNSLKCSCPLLERGCKWLGTLKDCEDHLDTCSYVRDQCELGCRAVLQRNDLKVHMDNCLHRKVGCEHCMKYFKFCDIPKHLKECPKMKLSCELCVKVMYREDMTQHLMQECDLVEETCKLGCGVKMTRKELKIHVKNTCVRRMIVCKHCFKCFKYCEMPEHLEECPEVELSCEMKCGKVMRRKENMTKHLMKECGLVVETCKLRCGVRLLRQELPFHLRDKCELRILRCDYCEKNFESRDLCAHGEKCPKMVVSCELKCSVIMCREDMEQHLKGECGLVKETCELGCGMKITRNKLKIHVKNTCVRRMIVCKHCFKCFKYCDMSQHLTECPRVKVSCELNCGIEVTRGGQNMHMKNTCTQRKIPCDHCFRNFKYFDMSQHLKECPRIKLSCELKCGVVMCREDMTQHLEEHCPEKEIACPFAKYNCKVRIKRKGMSKHLEKKKIEHTEMKLNGLEDIVMNQSILTLNWHEEIKIALNRQEETRTELNRQEEMRKHTMTVKRLSEQINTLCSINNTTKLEWNIQDITEFIKIVHRPPKREQVGGFIINTYFNKQSIWVSFENKHETTVVAKFMICLFSTIKLSVIKQYKHDISQFQTDVKQEISRIPSLDIQEFSRIGVTKDIILEMYITIM